MTTYLLIGMTTAVLSALLLNLALPARDIEAAVLAFAVGAWFEAAYPALAKRRGWV